MIQYHPHLDSWENPPLALAQECAGIFPLYHYLWRQLHYLERYTRDLRLLLDCMAIEGLEPPGTPRRCYWWHDIALGGDSDSPEGSIATGVGPMG